MSGVFVRGGETQGKPHVMREAETGAMQLLQVKEPEIPSQPPEARGGKEGFPY